jgi:hypothetical protein
MNYNNNFNNNINNSYLRKKFILEFNQKDFPMKNNKINILFRQSFFDFKY